MKALRARLYRCGVFLLYAVCILQTCLRALAQPTPAIVWSERTHDYFVSPVTISPDGLLIASPGTNNSIRLANLTTGSAVRFLRGHTAGVASLAFSPNGSILASTADDRTLRLWDVSTGALLRTISQGGGNVQFTSVAFHPDGQHVASDRNRTNVALWKVSDGTSVWETPGNRTEIESIAFSPDGSLIAAAGGYRGMDVRIRIIRASDGQSLQSLTTSNTYGVRQLAFSPDGKWIAAGCDRLTNFDGQVEIWRVADWTRVRQLPVHAPALAFSPDGKLLVTVRQKAMEVWQMPEGTLIQSFGPPTNGDYSPHLSIAVSPKSDRIVTGNYRFPGRGVPEGSTVATRFPILMEISAQSAGFITLNWSGGYPLYQLQRRFLDNPNWANLGDATTNRSTSLLPVGPGAMFRVNGVLP